MDINEKETEILDFFEGYIILAIEGLRKEKEQERRVFHANRLNEALKIIFTTKGSDGVNKVISKYNLDTEFGVKLMKVD